MNSLIKQETHRELERCFNDYFQFNLILDDYVYFLQHNTNLIKYADFIHHKISHLAPLLADDLQEWADKRNDRLYRAKLELGQDFASILEWTQYILEYSLKIESDLYNAIKVAIDEEDITEDMLRAFYVDKQSNVTYQILKFNEAIRHYAESDILPSFNEDFESYVIPYFKDEDDDD